MTESPEKKNRFEPTSTELSEPFWDATREQRLLLQWCATCEAPIFYPREVCPRCLSSESLEWRQSTGTGTIYAASVQEKPGNPMMAARVPYVVALIELQEGVRVMSNVVNCEPYDAAVGKPVLLTWEPLSDGRHLPQFELTQEHT